MRKAKLVVYVLERRKNWSGLNGWVLVHENGALVASLVAYDRKTAVRMSASLLLSFLGVWGQAYELRIRKADGTFSPGRTYPRSADPKRSKG